MALVPEIDSLLNMDEQNVREMRRFLSEAAPDSLDSSVSVWIPSSARGYRDRSPTTTGFVYEFWRFVFVKQEIARYAQTFLAYPSMQAGATFNLEALKAELEKKMEALQSQHSQ